MAAYLCHCNLFGPLPGIGVTTKVGPNWWWLTALTANTKLFRFDLEYSKALDVRWVVVWMPNNIATACRLIAFDYAVNGIPQNVFELGLEQSQGHTTPVNGGGDITCQFNTLITNKVRKHIGFQMRDNNINAWTLYDVRIEINFER